MAKTLNYRHMKIKTNFNTFVKTWGIIFIISIALLLFFIETIVSFNEYKARTKESREHYIAQQKNMIKREVEHVVNLINYEVDYDSLERNVMEKRLLQLISKIRFGKEGYIFVINSLNGDALVSNGKILSGTEKLWDTFNDNKEKMKERLQMMYDAAQKPDGDFIYYSFIKLSDSNIESPKVSFIYEIKSLQWLIGAGVYLDDIEKEISLLKGELYNSFILKMFYTIIIVVISIILFLFLLNILFSKLKNDLDKFFLFFKKSSFQNEPINLSEIRFVQFEEVAKSANKMLKDKMEAQQNLIDEKELLSVTIQSIGDAVITTNKSGKVKLMNPVAEKLTGWSLLEAKDKYLAEIFNIVNAQTCKKVNNPVNKVLEDGKIVGLANHTKLISRDGAEYQITDSAAPIKNNEGDILGVVLVFRDVTNKYKIQSELIESESKFKALFNGINDAIFVEPLLEEGFANFIEVNEVACNRLGYTKDQLLNMSTKNISNLDDLYHHGSKEERTRLLKNKWNIFEAVHVTKYGKEIPVEISSRIFEMNGANAVISLVRDISERTETEKKLRESEEQFRKTFEINPDSVTISRLTDGKYIDVNKGFIEITGYSREEIIGKSSLDINIWNDIADRDALLKKLVSKGKVNNIEAKFKVKNGNMITGLVSGTIMELNNESVMLLVTRDITDMKKAEHALKLSEIRYSRIASLTYEGILIHKNGVVIDVNAALERISGYSCNELLGKNIIQLLIDKKYHSLIKSNMQNNVTVPYEIEGIRKDGKIIQLEIESRNILYDDLDKDVRVTAIRDISLRKKTELEILKLSNAIEQSPVSIALIDIEGNIEYVNPRFSQITGYSYNEALDLDLRVLISDNQPDEFYKEMWNTISEGNEWKGEFQNKKKNGEFFWERAVISPIRDKKSKITHYMVIKENITETKEMMLELIKAKEDAEKADKMKSIFLAQMSHEIRTPINNLMSTTTLLKYDFEDTADKDQLASFSIIDRAVNRIVRTVELLLDLSEIQAGTYKPEITKIDLYSDVLAPVVAESRRMIDSNVIKLNLTNKAKDTELVADFKTVSQIFTHIIDNAIKYTNEGEVTVKISRNKFEQLSVEIKDTGIGISEEYLPNLFKPFTQEEMGYTRSYDGNGLGLALVKTYCQLNDAKIDVTSKKGIGSTFKVTFL